MEWPTQSPDLHLVELDGSNLNTGKAFGLSRRPGRAFVLSSQEILYVDTVPETCAAMTAAKSKRYQILKTSRTPFICCLLCSQQQLHISGLLKIMIWRQLRSRSLLPQTQNMNRWRRGDGILNCEPSRDSPSVWSQDDWMDRWKVDGGGELVRSISICSVIQLFFFKKKKHWFLQAHVSAAGIWLPTDVTEIFISLSRKCKLNILPSQFNYLLLSKESTETNNPTSAAQVDEGNEVHLSAENAVRLALAAR